MLLSKAPPYLTKLQLNGTVWLAADIHLGPHSPKTAQAFYAFLRQARQQTDALILCGDIFNAWVGADAALNPPGWLAQAIHHLRSTSQDLALYLMRGNRDFLLDQQFARYVGAQLLDDQILLCTPAQCLVLTHGDELCTDDVSYQRFRQRVRQPWLQRLFLKLPLHWRQHIAGGLRSQSRKKQRYTPLNISDVNTAYCGQLLAPHPTQLLVHGHTHRPAIHRLAIPGRADGTRVVLPDWEYDHSTPTRSGWLALLPDGHLSLHRLHQPTLRFKLN